MNIKHRSIGYSQMALERINSNMMRACGMSGSDIRRAIAYAKHWDWLLHKVIEKVRSYYEDGEHEINMKMAKLKQGMTMTKKQVAMFVETGVIRKEDAVDWDDVKKYTKNIPNLH